MSRWLVAGRNFGLGSSRPIASLFRELGVQALVAEEFNSLFLRNCINFGLPALTVPGATAAFRAGDLVFNRGRELSIGPAALAADPTARPASLTRLPRDVNAVGLAHGKPLRGKDIDRYATLIEKLTGNG